MMFNPEQRKKMDLSSLVCVLLPYVSCRQ